MPTYYTIDKDKLTEVIRIFNRETDPGATDELIEGEILADWHEGKEHQHWLDTASAQEIADWLASFYDSEKEYHEDLSLA